MITAVDTNILLDILLPNARYVSQSTRALEDAASGSLVICDPVYAELCVHFESQSECDEFLGDNDIRVEALSRPQVFWPAAPGGPTAGGEGSARGYCPTF